LHTLGKNRLAFVLLTQVLDIKFCYTQTSAKDDEEETKREVQVSIL
jgi:hypothetical protein